MKKNIKKLIILNVWGLSFLIICIIGLYIWAYFSPSLDIKTTGQYYLYDDEDKIIYQGSGTSKWVSLSDISDNMKQAIISIEDKNFYKHMGFDYLRIFKAFLSNIKNKEITAGASTISQQYVKNLFLDFDQTWERKIEEAWLTLKLEVHYNKDEILEGYLNTINFGQGNYGVENASEYYFNKTAKDLTMEEATILAGIPKSPSNFNPIANHDNSVERAKLVAKAMVNNKFIDDYIYDNLNYDKVNLYGKSAENNSNTFMYYQDAVMKELEAIDSVPKSLIDTGGIKIYTSYNKKAQEYLETAIRNNMSDNGLQVASVIINPHNGNVMALTGGFDYAKSQYNRAIEAKRQVGSTMKPILYYAALENGMTASSRFLSEKTTFVFSQKDSYSPQNYNEKYANREITMAAAISYSDNIYAVKTHLFLGQDALVQMAKRMGINEELNPIASLPLGTEELTMYDFANAYTTLAANGYQRNISLIEKVEDASGNILYEKKNDDQMVLNSSYVYILNELLTTTYNSSFIDYNNPTILSLGSKISRKYAMKSGSTGTDCYMVGYNPDILMMVWNGYDDNTELAVKDGMISKNIWVETVENILKDRESNWYETPNNVIGVPLNGVTGEKTNDSKKIFVFYYVKGSEYVNAEMESKEKVAE